MIRRGCVCCQCHSLTLQVMSDNSHQPPESFTWSWELFSQCSIMKHVESAKCLKAQKDLQSQAVFPLLPALVLFQFWPMASMNGIWLQYTRDYNNFLSVRHVLHSQWFLVSVELLLGFALFKACGIGGEFCSVTGSWSTLSAALRSLGLPHGIWLKQPPLQNGLLKVPAIIRLSKHFSLKSLTFITSNLASLIRLKSPAVGVPQYWLAKS